MALRAVKAGWTRRRLLRTGTVGTIALAACAAPQQRSRQRIGWLSFGTAESDAPLIAAFLDGMRQLGYGEADVEIIPRFTDVEGTPAAVKELREGRVSVIVSVALAASARPHLGDTPLVMTSASDPVEGGNVESLARPGGLITGVAQLTSQVVAKRVELLKEIAPRVSRIGLVSRTGGQVNPRALARAQEVGAPLGVTAFLIEVQGIEELTARIAPAVATGMNGCIVLRFTTGLNRVVELMAQFRLPAVYSERSLVDAGGLASLGDDLREQMRRAAGYVDKILRGAKAAELPIDVPEKLELVVNLKTASALGLTIPQSVLARANDVIR